MLESYKKTDMRWRWSAGIGLFVLFVIISHLLGRSLFTEDGDGFMLQILSVDEGEDLGSLTLLHWARYLIVLPFTLVGNAYLDPVIFFGYVGLFFFTINRELRVIVLLCLFFSLFFSYRSVLTMLSIALLVHHIVYSRKNIFWLFYSLLLSLLSTGTFVAYFIIFIIYHRIILSKKWSVYIDFILLTFIIVMSGSFMHKILFFLDGNTFDKANAVTMNAFSKLDFSSVKIIISNFLERGILLESYRDGSIRLYLIIVFSSLVGLLLYLRRDKISLRVLGS